MIWSLPNDFANVGENLLTVFHDVRQFPCLQCPGAVFTGCFPEVVLDRIIG